GRLPGRETQVGGADLGEFPGRAQAREGQLWLSPRDEHDLQRWRHVAQQEGDLLVAVALADHVIVVQHQDHGYRKRGQLVDQGREYRSGDLWLRHAQRAQDALTAYLRACALQRTGHMPPQPAGVVVAAVERDPGERPVFGITGAPLRYQGRLAESGRGADEHELGIGAGQEGD